MWASTILTTVGLSVHPDLLLPLILVGLHLALLQRDAMVRHAEAETRAGNPLKAQKHQKITLAHQQLVCISHLRLCVDCVNRVEKQHAAPNIEH